LCFQKNVLMKIKFISPINTAPTPMLFDTFIPTLKEQGHDIVGNVEEANIVFLDLYSGLGQYSETDLSYIINTKTPICVFDETDFGAMSTEVWFFHRHNTKCLSYIEYWILSNIFNNNTVIYFMRKMDKTKQYPSWVYPYELIQYPDHVFEPISLDELSSRENDIFFIGNTSPTRKSVCHELSKHFKCDFILGEERIPHEQWLSRARNAKLFLTSDGGGYGDERPYQLMYIAPMLRQSNNQLIVHNFRHGIDCVEVSEIPIKEEIKYLRKVLDDKFLLYDIYQNGMKRMRKYFNAEYRTNYILSILKQEGII